MNRENDQYEQDREPRRRRRRQRLIPMTPEEGVELYLESRQDDASDWTLTSHESRLRPWLEWCEIKDIDNLNDLDGRDLYKYRVWRREGNYSEGTVDKLAPKTLETSLQTLTRFLHFAGDVDAVHEDLYLKVPVPNLPSEADVSNSKIVPERVPPILDYLHRYYYASRDHVIVLLMWHTGARISGVRALDLDDVYLDEEKPGLDFVNRPESDTRLKNAHKSERFNRISPHVAQVISDYIDERREDMKDEFGRTPLISTNQGRASRTLIRNTLYKVTRPCWIGDECPHDKDPETCEWTYYSQASKCPSSRSPHDVRKARVTQYRNEGIHRGIVSDRLDASERVLDKHYDRASKREKADRRWRELNK